ncbi:MAG: hypothetical protein M3446_01475 [Actinomycetota bacterium]|nr:hypothetical protein [Geodermatophilaceae bacterium]MDQ3504361.1 hypothetical protein [Actinomycetota bacterium]
MSSLTLLGVAFLSALVPVVNLEIYLGGAMLLDGPQSWWEVAGLAAIAAIGQLAGKTLFYLAGRGVLSLPRLLPASVHAGANSSLPQRESRTARALARWKKRIENHRWLSPVFVGTSASVGLPPFALVSAAAGALRISLLVFLIAGLAGRWVRFIAVLALVQVSGA